MNRKVIWSTNATQEYALGLTREEKINFLIDHGYEEDMISDASDEQLDDIISTDDYLWQGDYEEFEYNIAPTIAKQTYNGLVIMVGSAARWDGTRQAGLCADATELVGGDIDSDVDHVAIIDDGEGLVWEGTHHDGTHVMNLYAIPEDHDNQRNFVEACMQEYIETLIDWHEYEKEDAIETAIIDLDYAVINDYCDFSKVPEVCQRIKGNMNESLEESTLNEVKAKDPKGLADELDEIKSLADEYGMDYFIAMPFTAFEDDPESIEVQYPNFFKVVKAFYTEMGILSREEAKDTDLLDETWYTDMDQHDWDTIIKVCEKLVDKPGKSQQIEKIYKDNYSDGIDDLAPRSDDDDEMLEY